MQENRVRASKPNESSLVRARSRQMSGIIWQHREILAATTLVDIRTRFIGTVFGLAWTILYPLLFLGLYAIVYTMIYRVKVSGYDTVDYVLLIFCGLVPFIGFADALGTGVSCILSNKALVKNTIFPIELIPVKSVLASSVTMTVGIVMLLGVLWVRGIVHYIFTVGVIWLLSATNVFIPDLGQTISIIILFLMLVSPIGYTEEMIPPELRAFMFPNPLYYLIMLYRDAAYLGTVRPQLLAAFAAIALATWTVGGFTFRRLKPLFADHV